MPTEQPTVFNRIERERHIVRLILSNDPLSDLPAPELLQKFQTDAAFHMVVLLAASYRARLEEVEAREHSELAIANIAARPPLYPHRDRALSDPVCIPTKHVGPWTRIEGSDQAERCENCGHVSGK